MKFEYDPEKSAINTSKHGLSLERAKDLWLSPYLEIKAKTVNEERFMVIGKIDGKLYSCIYTMRGDKLRLISARRSRKSEEDLYHDNIKA